VFINFNYTDTLQKLYNVPNENILYIHNKANDNTSTLILGHSRNPEINKSLEELYNDEDTDPRVAEGNRMLDNYFKETYKSTERIIIENISLFNSLLETKEIYVLGHSLSKVDLPYFKEIIVGIDKTKVKWVISFYNKKELVHHRDVFKELGIDPALITFIRLIDVGTQQLSLFPDDN
jgi:hypothetical protein